VHPTKDGVLVANHDPCLSTTTDIFQYEDLFKERKYPAFQFAPDGWCIDDYLINNFTLAELKMLRRRMRYPTRNQGYNGLFQMMSVEEIIQDVFHMNAMWPKKDRGTKIGLYIETKLHPYYLEHGFDTAQMLFDLLKKYNIETVEKSKDTLPIIIESFWSQPLIEFKKMTDLPTIFLYRYRDGRVPDWKNITQWANGIGPDKRYLSLYKGGLDSNGKSVFCNEAHENDLLVHPWVLRNDELYFTDNAISENNYWKNVGVDGIFTEFVGTTLQTLTFKHPKTENEEEQASLK